ncbi:MAG: hypothetical protein JWS12_498 [Candidatus Saccharibacteria bacterium]|nr:hypothetical protein [Candidatus Saccharibacteria bacterium]
MLIATKFQSASACTIQSHLHNLSKEELSMERKDLFTGHNDYGQRAVFDAAESGHSSDWGTAVGHEIFLHGDTAEVNLLAKGLRTLKAHEELGAALNGTNPNTESIEKLLGELTTADPTKRKEFVASIQKSYVLDERPE